MVARMHTSGWLLIVDEKTYRITPAGILVYTTTKIRTSAKIKVGSPNIPHLNDRQNKVLAYICMVASVDMPISVAELALYFDIRMTTMEGALRSLIDKGLIQRVGCGKYAPNDSAQKVVTSE
jgi:hypothetical protein